MMKLPFFFDLSNKPPVFLTIDIGSEAVKCLAFAVSEGDKRVAEIVGIGRSRLIHGSTRAGAIIDMEEVESSVGAAISEATEELGVKVSDAVFGVSGDLSFGLMTTVKAVRSGEDSITEKEIKHIYERIYDAAYSQALNEVLEITGSADLDIDMITSSTVYTKLDGHIIDEPVGRDGANLEVAVFTAFAPLFHIKALQKLAKKLRLNILAIGSQMYALVKSLEYSKGRLLDCVIMDVGSELTEVGVVFGGGILSTRTLPIGGMHFTDAISKAFDITYLDAEDKKISYSFDRLPEEESIKVQNSLNDTMSIWVSGIEQLFSDFTGVKTFAPDVYVVGGGFYLPDVLSSIRNEPWTRAIPFKSPPDFSKLSIADLPKVTDTTGKADCLDLILLASLSIIYLESRGHL